MRRYVLGVHVCVCARACARVRAWCVCVCVRACVRARVSLSLCARLPVCLSVCQRFKVDLVEDEGREEEEGARAAVHPLRKLPATDRESARQRSFGSDPLGWIECDRKCKGDRGRGARRKSEEAVWVRCDPEMERWAGDRGVEQVRCEVAGVVERVGRLGS
eukprot:2149951-Rhodomonas_salina.1